MVLKLNQKIMPLELDKLNYSALLQKISDARFVLIGEASHGTHEFYQTRAQITQQLITEKGFNAIAIEGDWPDAYRVNRYLQNPGLCLSKEVAFIIYSVVCTKKQYSII